jgi:hypothetical protein
MRMAGQLRVERPAAVAERCGRLLALGLLAVYFALNAPRTASIASYLLSLPRQVAGESAAAACARLFGAPYCRAIDELRRTLPVDRPYLLVAGDSPGTGATYWVRYDLAPRRAVYLGQLNHLTAAAWDRLDRLLPADFQQVVIACSQAPASLLDRRTFAARIGSLPPSAPGTPGTSGTAAATAAATTMATAACGPPPGTPPAAANVDVR